MCWIRKEKKIREAISLMFLVTGFFMFIMLLNVLTFSSKPVTGMQVYTACVFFESHPFSHCPPRWLSHSLNVQAGMSPFPRDGPDLTTVRPTPHAGNPFH